jgi:prepilin-type N-terminal cleavage/methylation domain-containing protein
MTLIEVLVVMTVLGLVSAVVLPALVVPRNEPAGIGQVVRNARALAIRRAQTLRLSVEGSGRWVLRAEAEAVDSGGIATPAPIELLLSPTGHCRLTSPLPVTWRSWDVSRCRAEEGRR